MISQAGSLREASVSLSSEFLYLRYCSISFISELPPLLWYHLGEDSIRLSLIAMAMSFGNRSRSTKAWMKVVTSNAPTVSVATEQRKTFKVFVTTFFTTFEYLMVAIAAPVIGKVYAHQANENLQIIKEQNFSI